MTAGTDWSRNEVEAAVGDYFDMLTMELRGEPFNKAEHNRRLQRLLAGRTKSAIEKKYQNISAVLIELGYPYVNGYKPLPNFQRSLLPQIVERRLSASIDLQRLIEAVVNAPADEAPIPADLLSICVPPPKADPDDRTFRFKESPNRVGRVSQNYLEIEARNRILAEAYRRHGYKVEEMLGGGADGGIDLLLRKDGRAVAVQCKRWKGRSVSVSIVRELYGVMIDQGASAAKIVATTNFAPDATAFANGKPIELVDSEALLRLVRSVQKSPRIIVAPNAAGFAPTCPKCSATMILREARRGAKAGQKFWGCPAFPGCRGTRPL